MPTVRHPRVLLAALAAVTVLAGCGAGGGSDAAEPAAETTAAPAAETTAAPDEASEPDETEDDAAADPAGADDVADLMADYLETSRAALSEGDSTSSTADVQATFRELRNALFETDGDLRDVDVADPDLADAVNDFYATAADAIAAFDEITTADPSTLGQADAEAGNQAAIDGLGTAVTLREAALTLAADGAVPDGPSPSEVLAVPDDFEDVDGAPAYTTKPEGELPLTQSGPCGKPSSAIQVPPRTFASTFLEDPQVSIIQRVLAFADEDEAAAYADAVEEAFSCDDPDGYASAKVEPLDDGDGVRIQTASDDGFVSTLLVEQDGSRVVTVDVLGDQISGGLPLQITQTHAEAVLDAIRDRAA